MNRITGKEKISYGMGDLACNTMFTAVSSFLMFFYTDIAGIGLAAVGTIMLIARIVDAITDPMMGMIVDKTNTKWGRGRPYVLWMAIPFAIISVLMFMSPAGGADGKFAYALFTYVLFCVIYTALNIPYTAMLSNLTDNSNERLSFNMFKSIGSAAGGFVATGLTLVLANTLGGGNQAKGFPLAMAVYGVVAILLLVTCFVNTKERIMPENDGISIRDSLKAVSRNRPWILLCLLAFLGFTGIIIRGQGAMYFAKYYLEQENAATILLSLSNLLSIPMAIMVPFVAKKIGKRNCILAGNGILGISFALAGLAGKNFPLILLFSILGTMGSNLAIGISFVMSADTVDYSEWKTGIRPQGLQTAGTGFMVKLGMAAAGVVAAAVMSRGGYVENVTQTAESIAAIRMNFIWIPVMISMVSIIIALFYDLDKKNDQILADLHERRAQKGQVA